MPVCFMVECLFSPEKWKSPLKLRHSGILEPDAEFSGDFSPSFFFIWIKELRDILKLGKLYIIICVYIYFCFDRCHTVVVVFKS